MAEKVTTIIILHETLWQSVVRDTYTFGALAAVVGLGVYLESAALQWIGGIIWMMWLLSRAARLAGDKSSRLTVEEARRKLDDIEAGRP